MTVRGKRVMGQGQPRYAAIAGPSSTYMCSNNWIKVDLDMKQ
jgi:hypothetical protein